MRQSDKMMGFVLTVSASSGGTSQFEFASSGHAEGVLRGLVHSGFMVTIQETMITVPAHVKVQRELDAHEEAMYKNRRDEVGCNPTEQAVPAGRY